LRAALRTLGLAAAAVTLAALEASAAPVTIRSAGGHFILRVSGIGLPERINHLHGFDLVLTTTDAEPVTGASIVLTGERRFAPNPLPTLPQVRAAPGPGNYRVEGLRFHMAGEWHLVFAIEFAQIHDRAALDVVVK
jgi:hypothetical protein